MRLDGCCVFVTDLGLGSFNQYTLMRNSGEALLGQLQHEGAKTHRVPCSLPGEATGSLSGLMAGRAVDRSWRRCVQGPPCFLAFCVFLFMRTQFL